MANGRWIKTFEINDALEEAGTGEWELTMIVPPSPPKTKICVPLCRGGHHSLLVVDNTKKEYAILSSTYAKPNPVDWPQWTYSYDDATPRNVPKQENGSDCGAYTICFGEIISTWSVIKKRMSKDDVGVDDINNVRSKLS